MITIKELLNKVKWDKKENPEDYTVGYWDNRRKELIEFPFKAIKEIGENFILIEVNGEEKDIPIHTIKVIKKKGETIYRRPYEGD